MCEWGEVCIQQKIIVTWNQNVVRKTAMYVNVPAVKSTTLSAEQQILIPLLVLIAEQFQFV